MKFTLINIEITENANIYRTVDFIPLFAVDDGKFILIRSYRIFLRRSDFFISIFFFFFFPLVNDVSQYHNFEDARFSIAFPTETKTPDISLKLVSLKTYIQR